MVPAIVVIVDLWQRRRRLSAHRLWHKQTHTHRHTHARMKAATVGGSDWTVGVLLGWRLVCEEAAAANVPLGAWENTHTQTHTFAFA